MKPPILVPIKTSMMRRGVVCALVGLGALVGCQAESPAAPGAEPSPVEPVSHMKPITTLETDTNYSMGTIPANQDSAVVRLYLEDIRTFAAITDSVCSYSVRITSCCGNTTEIHGCGVHLRRTEVFLGDSAIGTYRSASLVGSWSRTRPMFDPNAGWDSVSSDGNTPFAYTERTWLLDGNGGMTRSTIALPPPDSYGRIRPARTDSSRARRACEVSAARM